MAKRGFLFGAGGNPSGSPGTGGGVEDVAWASGILRANVVGGLESGEIVDCSVGWSSSQREDTFSSR